MVALHHVDLADVGEAQDAVGCRVVEFRAVEQAAVHRRDDVGRTHDGDGGAQFLVHVGGEAVGAVFEVLHVVGGLDLLLEPAERLGRHRSHQEADEVELEDVLDQFVVERLTAAVANPAQHLVGVPAERRRGGEQGEGLVLAVPVAGDFMAAVERSGDDRVLKLQRADDGAGGQQVQLQTAARKAIDDVDIVLGEFMEDVARRPRALKPHGDGLGAGDIGHRKSGRRRTGRGRHGACQKARGAKPKAIHVSVVDFSIIGVVSNRRDCVVCPFLRSLCSSSQRAFLRVMFAVPCYGLGDTSKCCMQQSACQSFKLLSQGDYILRRNMKISNAVAH